MKRAVAPTSDFTFHCGEPVDGRPHDIKYIGVYIAQNGDGIGGHLIALRGVLLGIDPGWKLSVERLGVCGV